MSKARNLAQFGNRTLLSARLTAPGVELVALELDEDTLYRISAIIHPNNIDGAVAWQSRSVSGGAWDAGGSDYSVQYHFGVNAGSSGQVVSTTSLPTIASLDAGTTNIPATMHGMFYTGSSVKWPALTVHNGNQIADASGVASQTIQSYRRANVRARDFRLAASQALGFGTGSRLFLEKLG